MEGVTSIAYADDLVLIVEAVDVRDLVFKTNKTLEAMVKCLETNKLEIGPQKSEAMIVKEPRKREKVVFNILGTNVFPKK